jgi:hypothetical protein
LRISPGVESSVYRERISHIIEVLRWSGKDKLGKCWDTWDVFCKRIDWISDSDLEGILTEMEKEDKLLYRSTDREWLTKLKECKNITDAQKARIDTAIEI